MRGFLILCLALPSVLTAGDLRENAFFKALQGSWTGDGEFLTLDKPPTPLRNHIEASFSEDGTEFRIKGTLLIDENPMDYVWTYSTHEIEGLYRALWKNLAQPDFVLEYSVNIDQAALVATLEPAVGASGSSLIRMVKRVEGNKYQVEIRVTDASGNETLQGTVRFVRD
ncbi:MAG: hypothetical protein ABL994_16900 [Verrucomicrobiales bacterium]